MVRRVTPSQFNSMVRRAQQQHRQAVNKANREIRSHNQKVKQAAQKLDREVRAYNARVRAIADGCQPQLVFEDRRDHTTMWRRNGLFCCQVAEADQR